MPTVRETRWLIILQKCRTMSAILLLVCWHICLHTPTSRSSSVLRHPCSPRRWNIFEWTPWYDAVASPANLKTFRVRTKVYIFLKIEAFVAMHVDIFRWYQLDVLYRTQVPNKSRPAEYTGYLNGAYRLYYWAYTQWRHVESDDNERDVRISETTSKSLILNCSQFPHVT